MDIYVGILILILFKCLYEIVNYTNWTIERFRTYDCDIFIESEKYMNVIVTYSLSCRKN